MKVTRKLWTWVLAAFASLALVLGLSTVAYAAAGDEPDHDKTLTVNNDGTYTIALNVTGDSEKQITKVNVIVIVDRSGSMSTQSGTGAYVPTNSTGTGLYGLIDGAYVPLERRGGQGNRTFWYNGVQYTGQRYQYDNTATRMQATQSAVNTLAENLLDYNGKDGNPNDTVQIALVSFATTAQTNVNPTTNYTTFSNAVNGLNANGGTNWEAALQQANGINFGDSDPTYVIFFSDGSPTFHSSDGGYDNWNNQYNVYGSGQEQEPNMERSYTQAVDDAATLASKVGAKNFYTIFAYGTNVGAGYMSDLTEEAGAPAENNYSASNTAELKDAFDAILESIEMAGIGAVSINDGTTSSVATTSGEVSNLLTVDTTSYKYYRAGGTDDAGNEKYDSSANGGLGEEWTGAPAATFEDGAVKWDLSSEGVLENDVTYTVTFDCWPSQTTLDIVADIKNDPSSYDKLDANIKKYIDRDGNLTTNTAAFMSYVDTRTGNGGSLEYDNPDPVETQAVEQLAVSKEWENELDGQTAEPITLTVTRDGEDKYEVELSNDNDWTDSVFISIGIIRGTGANVEVLETGHDFTFTEPEDLGYYWELEVPTVRPMLINNTLTMLILKGDAPYDNPDGTTEYTIDGKTYYVGDTGEASLTATNHRRARLNLTKVVDGEDADPEQTFPFTLNVVDSKASEGSADDLNSDYYVWFSIYNGGYVDGVVSGADKEMDGGEWTGYYYAPSGSNIVVNLKAGDNLRFLNLPSGSTYTFTEGTLPDNYAFVSSELTTGTDSTFKGAQTTTGTIEETNTDYTVTYTNEYALTDIEITKVWVDNDDQDGMRPTAEEFEEYLVLKADGTDVTSANADKLEITDNEDNTYTAKWTGLTRFSEGEEIEYTVEETEIEGYTTTGSPAEDKGTITNTHTPEVIDVTVVKEWDDSDNIGNIRPTSVSAQLTADGVASGDPVTLNEGNEWTYTWSDLPKYKNGTEIVYSADETAVPAGYTKSGPEKATAEDGTITFTVTNTYTPTPITASFQVEKILSVPDGLEGPEEWSYDITVAANNGAPTAATMTGTVDQDETSVTFGDFTFTMPGTYTYTVTESGTVAGVTNDSAATSGKTVTITVADNGQGVLAATVSPTTGITFTNSYSVEPTTASFPVKKILSVAEGLNAPDITRAYTITLAAVDGAPMPQTTSYPNPDADGGVVTFGAITYDAPGTYEYTVTESGAVPGVTNDSAAESGKTITVTVEDNGDGTLTATPSSTANAPVSFTNTYQVGEVDASIPVKKTVTVPEGMTGPEDWTYTITAVANDGAPEAETMTATVTKASPSASIGAITFTEPGNYSYTVTESGTVPGVTNGTASYDIDIVVTDEGDGTLSAVVNGGNAVEFTNAYNVQPVTASFPVEKELVVPDGLTGPEEWSYDITVAANDDAPEAETMTGTVDQDETSVTFGDFTYDAPGTYTYTVTESGTVDGVTNDAEASTGKTVTVTVEDNGDGTLTATVSPEAGITFTNTYGVEPTTASFPVEKILSVPEGMTGPEEWSYDISVTAQGEAPVASVMSGAVNQDVTSITFGPISYTTPGTYTYTVTESGTVAGVTNDAEASKTVTVTVVDNGDGTLSATVSPEAGITFTNTYNASGEATINVTKGITGAAWPAGKTLTLTIEGDDPMPETTTAELTAAGSASFGPIAYTTPGEYVYTISEDGFGDGWTGSGDVTATVTVEDGGDGKLVATVTYSPENATITNTYASTGSVTLEAMKQLEGRDWADNDEYTFTLTDKNGNVIDEQTVTSADAVSFSTINYTQDDVANSPFEYTITETIDSEKTPNVTNKSGNITVSVALTDDGAGNITATPTYTPDTKTIINTYTPKPVNAQINVNKTIEGFITGADQTFTFTMTPVDDAPMPEGATELTATITTKDGLGSTSFDEIQYTEAGEYTYTVVETKGTAAGFIYDTSEYSVTVKVTDDPTTGELSAEVVYAESATAVEVINKFAEEATSVTLHVDKRIEDQSGSAEDATFTFVLTPGEGAPGETQTKTITTSGFEGGVDFDAIEFDEAGTFNYTIQETGEAPDGWTYDTKEYPVVITITDDFEDAILNSETTIDGASTTSLTITNVYKAAETETTLIVTKEVEDTSGSAPDIEFEFTLAGDDPLPEVTTGTAKAGESVEFGPITYEQIGDYNYTITETAGDGAGWTYDTKAYDVVVTVEDEGGKLVATVVYNGDESLTELTVTNTYDPEDATAAPKAHKVIDDQSGSAPDETFTFTLTPGSGAPGETQTKTIKNGGYVEFDEITFDKVGTFTYTIQETAGSTKGFTYDTAAHEVTITVTDDGEGNLKAEVKYADGDEALITNVYKAEPVDVPLTGVKVLEGGKKLEEGEFTFELTDNDGNKVEGTFTNDADGNIDFGSYTFEKVGTYTYTATEVAGDDSHITYDSGSHKFTIEVTDNGGTLEAKVTGDEGELVKFENTYTPDPVTIDPPVEKVITGDTPASPATFTFQMKAITEGAPMPSGSEGGVKTMSITGSGMKEFGVVTYTEPGEWVYEITEVEGNAEGWTYDTKVYTLTVTVTQNDDGSLEKTETLDGGTAIVFTNKYEKPSTPKTGDVTPQVGMVAMAGVVATGAAFALRRRRED